MSAGEIWGSLSVADHVGRRALVAEVLLFDRLVIPTPPPGDDEQKRAWSRNRWNPGRQRRLLDIVGDGGGSDDLAVTVPWTKAKRDQFKAMSSGTEPTTAQLGQERGQLLERLRRDAKRLEPDEIGLKPDAMMRTRELLTREYDQHEREYVATLPSTWVEKIVPAYASFAKANGELRLRPIEKDRAVPSTQVIGWNLFVPNESDWSDERALEAAAKLARTDDYRLEREGLRDWWRSNVGAGMPPELAVLELNRRADRLNKVASAGKTRTRALRSLALLGGGTAIGGVWFPPVAIAGGLLALVSVGADWVLGYTPAPAGLAPAAMIRNARGALAWYGKAS